MWNIWDIIICVIVALQFVAFGFLGYVLLQLKNGPILRYIRMGMRLVKTVTKIGVNGLSTFGRNWMKGEELVRETKGIGQGLKYGTRLDFGDEISYKTLLATWLAFRSSLGTALAALVFLKGLGKKKEVPPPGPTTPTRLPRRSLADRMGIVPPIARPLGRWVNYGRIAWDIRNELKRRGISPF